MSTFRTNNPRVIKVDAEAAQEEGVKVMTVSENIVISENIPPQHLSLLPSREILASQNRDD